MSLDVQNKITVRHTLTLAEGALPEDYTVSLTTTSLTNAQASLEYDDASGKFYAVVEGIEGPNLNMTYTLTITNENDGSKAEIKNFCALNYAKYVLSADLGNSDLENVVRGMCMYNLLADAYFEKLQETA